MNDIADHPRIAGLMDLIASLGRAADPREALAGLASGLYPTPAYVELSTRGGNRQYVIHRMLSDEGVELTVPPATVFTGGFLGQLIRLPQPKTILHADLLGDPVLPAELQDYRSAIAAPIFVEQSPRDWVVLLRREPDGFDIRDLESLIIRTSLVAALAANLQITQQLFEANLKSQQEFSEIAEIQQALLPEEIPAIPGLRIAASYQTAGQSGGDLYDFVSLGPVGLATQQKRWAILIADVSGHGAAAAVVMAMLHSILHAFPHQPAGPAEVLSHANRHLCEKRIGRAVTTAFLAFFDPDTRTLTYARAGQTPPLLFDPAGAQPCKYLDAVGDLPLGVSLDSGFSEGAIQLSPGQTVILYTDGVTEARDIGGRLFELSRLEAAMTSRTDSDPDAVIRRIRQAILTFADGIPMADDQTIVAIHVC
jgi:sigma-B regulation protein RsbU (phosphoserine phosphatase)